MEASIAITRYDGLFFIGEMSITEIESNVLLNPAMVLYVPVQVQAALDPKQMMIAYQTNIVFLGVHHFYLPYTTTLTTLSFDDVLALHYKATMENFRKSQQPTRNRSN